jgi:hypothetical protein
LDVIRDIRFWLHLILVTFAILPRVLLEALASMARRGGAVVVVLKPRT